MVRVLICDTFGGWGLSRKALHRLRDLGSEQALAETDSGETWPGTEKVRESFLGGDSFLQNIPRDDPLLLQVWDELGQDAAGQYCHIAERDIPEGVSWHVEEYDGNEHIAEDHRTW